MKFSNKCPVVWSPLVHRHLVLSLYSHSSDDQAQILKLSNSEITDQSWGRQDPDKWVFLLKSLRLGMAPQGGGGDSIWGSVLFTWFYELAKENLNCWRSLLMVLSNSNSTRWCNLNSGFRAGFWNLRRIWWDLVHWHTLWGSGSTVLWRSGGSWKLFGPTLSSHKWEKSVGWGGKTGFCSSWAVLPPGPHEFLLPHFVLMSNIWN